MLRKAKASAPLTCRELVELVTAYLDGALAEPDRLRFDQHLVGCDGCRAYVEQMRLTIATLGRLSPDTIPATTRDRLLATFRTWNADR